MSMEAMPAPFQITITSGVIERRLRANYRTCTTKMAGFEANSEPAAVNHR